MLPGVKLSKKRGAAAPRATEPVRFGHPLFGAAHLRGELIVADADPEALPLPVWIQIARTGKWMGHAAHPEGVEFTRQTFDQVIANLHAHPSFKLGAGGVGVSPVVPFDYEHASEMDPTSGSIPENGAPAPAWVLDLQVRASADGEAEELWALTDLGKKARQQIADKQYRWTSVSIWPKARDAETNQPIGAVLTSVAFTNHPFITGMTPMIAASRRGVQASVSVYGGAESVEEAIVGLRDIFGLAADATVGDITAQFERLRTIMASPPPDEGGEGYELYRRAGDVICRLRELLDVPVLATIDEIIAAGGQILSAMSLPAATALPAPGEPNAMSTTTSPILLARLSKLFKLRDGASDELILAAAEKQAADGDALDKLIALFGSSDTQSMLTDAAKLVEKAKKADEYLTALNAAQSKLGVQEQKEAETEVEQIAASTLKLDAATAERLKPLLLKERLAVKDDPVKLAEFRQRYPLPTAQQQVLTTSLVAGPNGSQLGGPPTGMVNLTAPVAGGQQPTQHPLETYPGVNAVSKAMAYLTDKRPGFKAKSRIDQVHEAGLYLRQGAPVL